MSGLTDMTKLFAWKTLRTAVDGAVAAGDAMTSVPTRSLFVALGKAEHTIAELSSEVSRLTSENKQLRDDDDDLGREVDRLEELCIRLASERDRAQFERDQERHARRLNETGLLAKIRDLEARVAAMKDVVEAAKLYREQVAGLILNGPERALVSAVDAYNEGADKA